MLFHFDSHHHLLPSVRFALLLTQMKCAGPQISVLVQQIEDHRLQSKCGDSRLWQMDTHEVQPHPQIVKDDVYTLAVLAANSMLLSNLNCCIIEAVELLLRP